MSRAIKAADLEPSPVLEILNSMNRIENEQDETTLTLLIELVEGTGQPKNPPISLGEIALCVAAGRPWWADDGRIDYITDAAYQVMRGGQGYFYLGTHPVTRRMYEIGAALAAVFNWPDRVPCKRCGR